MLDQKLGKGWKMNGPDPQQQQPAETPDQGASKPKHVERLTVSRKFREIAKKCLPGLDLDPAHWQFFGYVLFGSSFDEESGKLLIGQPKIAKVLGEDANNFVAIDYLEKFQREVMPTTLRGASTARTPKNAGKWTVANGLLNWKTPSNSKLIESGTMEGAFT